MSFFKYVYPFNQRRGGVNAGLSKFEWIAANILIALARDCNRDLREVESRSALAVEMAELASRKFSALTNQPCWQLAWAFPVNESDGQDRMSWPGMAVLEYVVGRLLTATTRAMIWPCPALGEKAVDRAFRYGQCLADMLSVSPVKPAFPYRRNPGLSQRDMADVNVVGHMLINDDGSDPYRLACSAFGVVKDAEFPSPVDSKRRVFTKRCFFVEQICSLLVNHNAVHRLSQFAEDWADEHDTHLEGSIYPGVRYQKRGDKKKVPLDVHRGLTIREWSTAVIAGGLVDGLTHEDEIPDDLVPLAIERYDRIYQFLRYQWEFDIEPDALMYPLSIIRGNPENPVTMNHEGIDSYSWLTSQIMGELARTYGPDVVNPDLIQDMAEYSAVQAEVFWAAIAKRDRDMANSFNPKVG